MKNEISAQEINIAKEIVSIGLKEAAKSLSFFMKEDISLDEMSYDFSKPSNPADFISKKGNNIHLLITEVIGDLKGVCCLIFSSEEADKLRNTALPAEIKNNPELMAEMNDGILLEVDNIISASVITKFSNILKHKMHGGVPSIKKWTQDEINNFIKERLEKNMLIISFNTHFVSTSHDFSPQFLWLFDESFAKSIQSYASLNKKVSV